MKKLIGLLFVICFFLFSSSTSSLASHSEDFLVSGVVSNSYPQGDTKTYLRVGNGLIENGDGISCTLIDDFTNQTIDQNGTYYSNVPDKGNIIQLSLNLGYTPDGWTPASTYHSECTLADQTILSSNHFKYVISPTIVDIVQNGNELDLFFTPSLSSYLPSAPVPYNPYFVIQSTDWFDGLAMDAHELEWCEENVEHNSQNVSVCHFDLNVNPALPTTHQAHMLLSYHEPIPNGQIQYEGSSQQPFTVHSIRPELSSLNDTTIAIGGTYEEIGTFTDYDSTSFTSTIDFNEGEGPKVFQLDGNNFLISHQFNTLGYYPVTLTIYDESGHAGTAYSYITVVEPPQLSALIGSTIQAGGSYQETGTFTDPSSTSWNATVDYGEGNGEESLSLENFSFNLSNTYETPGQYEVIVKIKNNNEITGSSSTTIFVEEQNLGSVTLYPISDSYIKQGSQNENEGAATMMRLQSSGKNRGLVQFSQSEIADAIGTATNYSAKLYFTISDNGNNWGNNGRTIDLHRLTSTWTEGNGNGNYRGTGSGTTWSCAVDTNIANQSDNCSPSWNMTNSSSWPFVASPTSSTTITNNQSGEVEIDVTSDIQSFMNGTDSYGWILKKTDEGQNGRVEFGTKESGVTPKLIITFN